MFPRRRLGHQPPGQQPGLQGGGQGQGPRRPLRLPNGGGQPPAPNGGGQRQGPHRPLLALSGGMLGGFGPNVVAQRPQHAGVAGYGKRPGGPCLVKGLYLRALSGNNPFGPAHLLQPGANRSGTYGDFELHHRQFQTHPGVIGNAFSIGLTDGLIMKVGEDNFDFSEVVAKAGDDANYARYLNGGKMNNSYPTYGMENRVTEGSGSGREGSGRREGPGRLGGSRRRPRR